MHDGTQAQDFQGLPRSSPSPSSRLAAPLAALAVKAPGLASSSQYKAFIEYVKKMDGLTSQPTSTEHEKHLRGETDGEEDRRRPQSQRALQAGERRSAGGSQRNGQGTGRTGAGEGRRRPGNAEGGNGRQIRTARGGLPPEIRTDRRPATTTAKTALKEQIAACAAQKSQAAAGHAERKDPGTDRKDPAAKSRPTAKTKRTSARN